MTSRSLAGTYRSILRAYADANLRPHERARVIAQAEAQIAASKAAPVTPRHRRKGAYIWTTW